MEALANLPQEIDHLVSEFFAPAMYGNEIFGLTQYIFWMLVAVVLLLIIIFAAKRRVSLVPKGRFVNAIEFAVEFVRNDVVMATIGPKGAKHVPFLLSLFFFIAICNIVGIIPGCKHGTGTIGVTAALATVSFVYFIRVSIQNLGVGGYIKSLAPKGVVAPLAVFVGILEAFSTIIRLVSLAIRLFANMFAGHVVMGTFALMTSLCIMPMLMDFTMGTLAGALPSIVWMVILILIYAIEMAVAVIQAYVFTILSTVYIQLAESEH